MPVLPSDLFFQYTEHLNIGVFILDAAGNYVYTNEAYRKNSDNCRQFFENMSVARLMELEYIKSSTWELVVRNQDTTTTVITITDNRLRTVYDVLSTGIPFFGEDGKLEYVFVLQETMQHLNDRLYQGSLNAYAALRHSVPPHASSAVTLIAESPKMKEIVSLLDTVSNTDAPILISGESGSGKEVVANYIHTSSTRSDKPFLALNCAVIPENLIESELFGYEKGAFSGASSSGKIGLIEAAAGGTLFLDEINSMPLSLQTKLLRVLETKQITRIGSVVSRDINFRLVCASNEDLQILIREKRFRADLFYRINVISISIPPLKERPEDILALSLHFVQYYNKKYSCVKIISQAVLNRFLHYDWPGNVRELKNIIERMVLTTKHMELEIRDIPEDALTRSLTEKLVDKPLGGRIADPSKAALTELLPAVDFSSNDFSFETYMNHCEKQILETALRKYETPAAVAKVLKLDLSNVYRKMRKHGIKR